jgi:glycosyltransferase involved in cell wall biosynthesis
MAVYNGERYLEESVSSVLKQSFTDFELIVVDDGSTDGTSDLLAHLSREDSRIVVIRQENCGPALSLKRATGVAKGDYLARQDADDISMPERFERQVRYLDGHPSVGVVGTAAEVIDQHGHVIGVLPTRHGVEEVRRGLLTVKATLVHGSVMMRRHALEAVGGYRDAFQLSLDFDLWLRMVLRRDLDNLPEILYRWRLSPEGIYATRRATQLKYGGVALAFARERKIYGDDSYELLRQSKGDLDAFAARYRMRGLLHSLWGELLLRGLQNHAIGRSHLRRALLNGFIRPRTLCLLCWSFLGLAWPGSPPLSTSAQG